VGIAAIHTLGSGGGEGTLVSTSAEKSRWRRGVLRPLGPSWSHDVVDGRWLSWRERLAEVVEVMAGFGSRTTEDLGDAVQLFLYLGADPCRGGFLAFL